jgi:hypothetical protein
MKRNVLAAVLLLACVLRVCADVTDDFKSGGVAVGGSASVSYLNEGLAFGTSSESSTWSFSLAPSIAFFIFDFVDCSITPKLGYTHTQLDAANVSDSFIYGVSVGVGYYLLLAPSSPFVLHATLGIALAFSPGLPGTVGGVPFDDGSLVGAVGPFVTLSFYNFVTDRIAIDIALTPQLSFSQLLRDANGNTVSGPVLSSLIVNASIGITYVIAEQRKAPVPARSVLR